MCEQRVLKALKSHTKTLSFNNSDLKSLPAALGRLTFLTSFSAKNNALKTLPEEITQLTSVRDCRTHQTDKHSVLLHANTAFLLESGLQ